MTDNKPKRGRPPKTKVTTTTEPNYITIILPGTPDDGQIVTIETAKPVTIIPRRSTDETPYPSNWDTLSKVDKLQWLTAQKAKR